MGGLDVNNKPQPKHTPGPLVVYETGLHFIGTPDGLHICKTFNDAGDDVQEANEEFLVRAWNSHYEMLKALKVALANIEANRITNGTVYQLKKAIAKAEAANA